MPTVATTQLFENDDMSAVNDFGDFVKDEDEELDLEEVVEPLYKYSEEANEHVFYPVYIGEILNGRYLVEHKAGAGGFSTIWMAHDLWDKRDVALKIAGHGTWSENELRMHDVILRDVQDTSHLVTYLATFLLPGNKGRYHRVLVFPLMGPCVNYHIIKKLSMASRMSAAWQLLKSLEGLHNAGIIHRDLNASNCMWGMVPLHDFSRGAKYKALGRPLKRRIPIDTWKEGEFVRPVAIPDDLRTEKFYLGDFGLAMKLGDLNPQSGCPPMPYCSPDRLHGKCPSFACDMWSYMVVFCELYLTLPPFSTWHQMIRCLGPLPEQWKGLYIPRNGVDSSWYDPSITPDPSFGLAREIARFRPDLDPIEREHALSVMSRMFVYDPRKRLTAAQLLQDPSFNAIMEKYSG